MANGNSREPVETVNPADLRTLINEDREELAAAVIAWAERVREEPTETGCAFCGGLGHDVVDCIDIDFDQWVTEMEARHEARRRGF